MTGPAAGPAGRGDIAAQVRFGQAATRATDVTHAETEPRVAAVMDGMELRAAAFIVTVYGDVVLPRGGVLWTGTLIDICGRVGISESLVRTAVSRLVAAQRLRGERAGRRSYYRLDVSARIEFEQAATLLFAADAPARGWQILHVPDLTPEAARRMRMGHMGGQVFIRPDRGQPPPPGALVFHASDTDGPHQVARYWDLTAIDAAYGDMLARFGPLEAATRDEALPEAASLVARLLLVHAYRHVLLRDPRLPPAALPTDWKGQAARALFRALYLRLSPAAERHVGDMFLGEEGRLPARTAASDARLLGLSG